jgi:hypothetical protein
VALWRVPGYMPAGLPLQPGENRPSCLRPALSGPAMTFRFAGSVIRTSTDRRTAPHPLHGVIVPWFPPSNSAQGQHLPSRDREPGLCVPSLPVHVIQGIGGPHSKPQRRWRGATHQLMRPDHPCRTTRLSLSTASLATPTGAGRPPDRDCRARERAGRGSPQRCPHARPQVASVLDIGRGGATSS